MLGLKNDYWLLICMVVIRLFVMKGLVMLVLKLRKDWLLMVV